jgi:hypothetical protein
MRDGWVEATLDGIANVIMGQSPDGTCFLNRAFSGWCDAVNAEMVTGLLLSIKRDSWW